MANFYLCVKTSTISEFTTVFQLDLQIIYIYDSSGRTRKWNGIHRTTMVLKSCTFHPMSFGYLTLSFTTGATYYLLNFYCSELIYFDK